MADLARTALYDWHVVQGAKMVAFAGYEMPVQYAAGIVQEHQWTRTHAGLFDVSHMGQMLIRGADAPAALERLLPVDVQELAVGQQRYALLTNQQGMIDDDLMLTRREDDFYVVVNAACKQADFAKLEAGLAGCQVQWWDDRALLALQGPEAVAVLSALNPQIADLRFMHGAAFDLLGASCWVSRSGYTGEDGFELSVPNDIAVALADQLISDERVKPVGLGARDSLRLEAGLCLYGNDIDTTTTPVEAGLLWSIQKVRRPGGARAGGYPGAEVIAGQINHGVSRKRVGLRVAGRVPVRAGAKIEDLDGKTVGKVTSGGFAATLNAPVAMAYLDSDVADADPDDLFAMVRNNAIKVSVAPLPFVAKDYKK